MLSCFNCLFFFPSLFWGLPKTEQKSSEFFPVCMSQLRTVQKPLTDKKVFEKPQATDNKTGRCGPDSERLERRNRGLAFNGAFFTTLGDRDCCWPILPPKKTLENGIGNDLEICDSVLNSAEKDGDPSWVIKF